MFQDLINRNKSIGIIGLGYVGLPLAVLFSKKFDVIGFDIDDEKIQEYRQGKDLTGEVGYESLKKSNIHFTSDPEELKKASFFVIAVPTPITPKKLPDFKFIDSASEVAGKCISKGDIIVYESTVYPGVTEERCGPIIEKTSGLKYGEDFKLGYSPERINPGDKVHTLENIVKIVSGMDEESLEIISAVYGEVIDAGIYPASSIKVAEAAKVIENSQRDINIAFINEISMIFHKLGIDTTEVLEAAGTKWNFLDFKPGLVGGHCIGVDPYYFIYKAEELGYNSQLISTGRLINDNMGEYIGHEIIKKMNHWDKKIKDSNVLVFGITFKENSKDIRNTKVIDIINTLKEYEVNVFLNDPNANKEDVLREYDIELTEDYTNRKYDSIVIAVNHDIFKDLKLEDLISISNGKTILFDIKGALDKDEALKLGIDYWRL